MTLRDVDRLFKFWSRHPPSGDILLAIAKTLGIEYSRPTDTSHIIDNPQAAIAALEMFNKAGIRQR
jgi:hypothetical protein